MKHEKLIKRNDGSQIKIQVDLWCDSFRDEFSYRVELKTCAARKR